MKKKKGNDDLLYFNKNKIQKKKLFFGDEIYWKIYIVCYNSNNKYLYINKHLIWILFNKLNMQIKKNKNKK